MSKILYDLVVIDAISNTVYNYKTVEKDLFIDNFDLEHNLLSFKQFVRYVSENETFIYYMIA